MDSKSLQEHAKRVALELPFTEHCWPFGPEADVFKVGGKMFMLTSTAHGRPMVNLKSDPQKSLLNQQIYRSIEPGYHMNKKHWNTVIANRELNDGALEELILHSYSLIVESLPAKIRQELNGG